jgi:hypothetical protein
MTISWTPVPDATGYILRWSTEKDELYHACEVKDPKVSLGLFSSDTDYYFTVDAFNESGVTKGKEIIHVD